VPDYIPKSDPELNIWADTFVTFAVANALDLELKPELLDRLQTALAEWVMRFEEHLRIQNAARAATKSKNAARTELKQAVREAAMMVQARRATTGVQRTGLGITVPDLEPTTLDAELVQRLAPPVLHARCIEAQTVRIGWSHGRSRKLPEGVDMVQIWFAEQPAPGGKPVWRFLGLDSRTPYFHKVGNVETVTLLYRARWTDRLNRPGPFGNKVMVAVTP